MSASIYASIVIPLYNGATLISACLNALLPQVQRRADAEVLVIDNGSTDEPSTVLRSYAHAIHLHRLTFNGGFATAVNAGIRLSQGQVIILLNQDAIVQPGWLDALLAHVERVPNAAIVGSKCIRADGTLDHAGGVIRRPLFYTAHLGAGEADLPEYNIARTCDYVTGAAIALRRNVLDRIGLFDPGFYPGYYEETDLCLRAEAAGYEVWYAPSAVVLHHSDRTPLEQMSVERIAAFHRNRLRCLIKHTDPAHIGAVLREAELAEINQPQAAGLLTGRAIAYRDILQGALTGDPVLISRLSPDAIEALSVCQQRAYRHAERMFDDPLLPLARRIEMTPRTQTWGELRQGLERILAEIMAVQAKRVVPSPTSSLTSQTQSNQTDQTTPLPSSSAENPNPRETHAEDIGLNLSSLIEQQQALHRQLDDLNRRLTQLAEFAATPPEPAYPRNWRERLRVWRDSLRALPAIQLTIQRQFRWQNETAARTTSLVGEVGSLAGVLADALLVNVRMAQLHQQNAQAITHLYELGAALTTTCQFLHECVAWQADISRRLCELHRHTSAVLESEPLVALLKTLHRNDADSGSFQSSP